MEQNTTPNIMTNEHQELMTCLTFSIDNDYTYEVESNLIAIDNKSKNTQGKKAINIVASAI